MGLSTNMVFIKNDCWELIKTFAGIYSISMNWNINLLPLKRLCELYNQYTKNIHIKTKDIPEGIAGKLYLVNKCISEFNSKTLWINLNDISLEQYLRPPVILGCEVLYHVYAAGCGQHRRAGLYLLNTPFGSKRSFKKPQCGIVTKINKNSIRVAPYRQKFTSSTAETLDNERLCEINYTVVKEKIVYNWDKTIPTSDVSIRINKYEIKTLCNAEQFKNLTHVVEIFTPLV
jgi:hypothetical protein